MKPMTALDAGRVAVYGRRGMAATSQPLATAAALEILSQGGTAADAAVAATAALNVTEPTSTGIGGDMFALYYEAASGEITALNGSGRAPAALSLARLEKEGLQTLPPFHPYTITVPGAASGWEALVQRHGRLSLADVLAPAIRLAEAGFPVAPITAHFWARGAARQLAQAPNGHELTINGRAPRPGEIFRNPGLARTFRTLARQGARAFYEGEIAQAIAAVVQQAGGCLSQKDLAAHQATWETPISVTYRGIRVWECPPNGQGLAALLALNILEGFDLAALPPLSAERWHLQIEALRLAFADARWYIADPQHHPVPVAELLSKAYAAQRRRLIDPQRASADVHRGAPFASSDTVYLAVVDGEGNACSFINSNYMGFGTGIVPRGWGFTLQNRGHNFSLQADHPNALAPGKRPYHTIIPGMLTRADGSLWGPFGVMGGFMQPQGHVQVVSALVDDGLDPQAALNRPRFCLASGEAASWVGVEAGAPDTLLRGLFARGHALRLVGGWERALFGRGQIILRSPDGVLAGGSDPRADGCAMPFG